MHLLKRGINGARRFEKWKRSKGSTESSAAYISSSRYLDAARIRKKQFLLPLLTPVPVAQNCFVVVDFEI